MSAVLRRVFASVVELLDDNPVLAREASGFLRRPRLIGALAALVSVAAGGAIASSTVAERDLRLWESLTPAGAELLAAVVFALLAASTVFLPALGALGIAGERERGTLPLLVVSGLAPGRIVVGKVAAVVAAALPLLAMALPVFGAAALLGGVDVADVVAAVLAVVVYGVAQAAIGVWASAVTRRVRGALVLALAASAVPLLLGGFPIIGWVGYLHDGSGDVLGPTAHTGIAALVVIAAAALHGAWATLLPRRAPRGSRAGALLVAAVVAVPYLAAGFVRLAPGGATDDVALGPVVVAALLMVVAVAAFVGTSGRDPAGPSPQKAALGALGLAVFGSGAAMLVPVGVDGPDKSGVALALALAVVLAGTGLLAFGARRRPGGLAPFVLAASVLGVAFLLPMLLDEFTSDTPPLAFLNPGYAIDEPDLAEPSFAFWLVVGVAGLLAAGGPRPRRDQAIPDAP
jgi:hypothetical protein